LLRRAPCSTLFPYTTLFRSYHPAYHRIMAAAVAAGAHTSAWAEPRAGANVARAAQFMLFAQVEPGHACPISMTHAVVPSLEAERSEEHTSELQSRENLVCRL